jgi:hypothetical protein
MLVTLRSTFPVEPLSISSDEGAGVVKPAHPIGVKTPAPSAPAAFRLDQNVARLQLLSPGPYSGWLSTTSVCITRRMNTNIVNFSVRPLNPLVLLHNILIPKKSRPILRRSIQSLENIFSSSNRLPLTLLPLRKASRQRLNQGIIVNTEEKRNTVPSLTPAVNDSMHRALIQSIRPTHQEISDVDYERIGRRGSDIPVPGWFEDLESRH